MNSRLERQFSKYLANLMSKDEKTSFEKELALSKDLQIEFEEYQIGMVAGQRISYLEYKDKIAQIIEEEDSKNRSAEVAKVFDLKRIKSSVSKVISLKRLIPTAAAAIIIICIAAYIPSTQKSSDTLYTQHIADDPYSHTRGELKDDYILATNQFKSGNYDSTLVILDRMPFTKKKEAYWKRLKGWTLMSLENLDLAKDMFKSSISASETEDDLEAYWNLGRIYTKSEQYDSSLLYLKKIVKSTSKSEYKESAKKLLSDIKWQKFIRSYFGWLL